MYELKDVLSFRYSKKLLSAHFFTSLGKQHSRCCGCTTIWGADSLMRRVNTRASHGHCVRLRLKKLAPLPSHPKAAHAGRLWLPHVINYRKILQYKLKFLQQSYPKHLQQWLHQPDCCPDSSCLSMIKHNMALPSQDSTISTGAQ